MEKERVHLDKVGEKILIKAPYCDEFRSSAKAMGAKWDGESSAWTFHASQEESVKDMMFEAFGETPGQPVELVSIHLEIQPGGHMPNPTHIGARRVAERRGRDYQVNLGENVFLLAGKFPASAGSRNNPEIGAEPGLKLLIQDIPIGLARQEKDRWRPGTISIVGEDVGRPVYTVDEEKIMEKLVNLRKADLDRFKQIMQEVRVRAEA